MDKYGTLLTTTPDNFHKDLAEVAMALYLDDDVVLKASFSWSGSPQGFHFWYNCWQQVDLK